MVENSVGLKIKGAVKLIWQVGLGVVIAVVVMSTIVYANTGYWGRRSSDEVFSFFLLSSFAGGVFVLIIYVTKLFLEGFGELVYRSEAIDERLRDLIIEKKKESVERDYIETTVSTTEEDEKSGGGKAEDALSAAKTTEGKEDGSSSGAV